MNSGRCLCGAVRYQTNGPLRNVMACHCERCRRTSGHYLAATSAPTDRISLEDDGTLKWFSPAEDPNIGYAFCSTCGSSLFWRSAPDATQWSICAGTLDQPTGLSMDVALYASEAGDYHHLDPALTLHATE